MATIKEVYLVTWGTPLNTTAGIEVFEKKDQAEKHVAWVKEQALALGMKDLWTLIQLKKVT